MLLICAGIVHVAYAAELTAGVACADCYAELVCCLCVLSRAVVVLTVWGSRSDIEKLLCKCAFVLPRSACLHKYSYA